VPGFMKQTSTEAATRLAARACAPITVLAKGSRPDRKPNARPTVPCLNTKELPAAAQLPFPDPPH
jgi:hypothetical protein